MYGRVADLAKSPPSPASLDLGSSRARGPGDGLVGDRPGQGAGAGWLPSFCLESWGPVQVPRAPGRADRAGLPDRWTHPGMSGRMSCPAWSSCAEHLCVLGAQSPGEERTLLLGWLVTCFRPYPTPPRGLPVGGGLWTPWPLTAHLRTVKELAGGWQRPRLPARLWLPQTGGLRFQADGGSVASACGLLEAASQGQWAGPPCHPWLRDRGQRSSGP